MTDAASTRHFFRLFIALSLLSGLTIGMNKILVTLLGLSLSLENWQMGVISGVETLAMAVATLPAGILLSRYSPRVIYAIVSFILFFIYLGISHIQQWQWLVLTMIACGLCIAFRIVAMSSSFLQRLPEIGTHRAGWYKGTLSLGVMAMGPMAGHFLSENFGISFAFSVSGSCFLAMALLGWYALPTAPAPHKKAKYERGWLASIWRQDDIRHACLYESFGNCLASFFGTFILVITLREQHWENNLAVTLLVVYGLTYVSVLLGAGKLLILANNLQLYRLSHGLLIPGTLLLAFASHPALFFMGAVINATGLGLNNLVNMATIARSKSDKSHVSGVLTLSQMTGGTCGAVVGGWLGTAIGLQPVFLLLALPWIFRITKDRLAARVQSTTKAG